MQQQVVAGFRGKHFFLSNFFPAPVTYMGITFKNNEAAFQAAKCPERAYEFQDLDPKTAKRLGRQVRLRKDWEQVKDDVMYQICKEKFYKNSELSKRLLDTGNMQLVELNNWGDSYWGVYHSRGTNVLGNILMRIREELKHEA